MKAPIFNKNDAEHQDPCHGTEMASTLLPIRAWEAKKIVLSDEVYIRAGDHPPPFSVIKYHQTDITSV